jgi:hypothetical protein
VTFNHLAAALAYYVITARPTADHVTATKAKVVAGWSRLDDYSPMQSGYYGANAQIPRNG